MDEKEQINYKELLQRHPWIITKDKTCLLSPDSDGLLCGLVMSNLLNWEIGGFYDSKALIIKNGVDHNQCAFLDIEINRKGVPSIGNHLVE